MSPTQDLTRQLHENLWLVLSFAFGQPAVAKVVNDRFVGEFKYLWKTIDSIAEATANRALKDIGNQLRELDKRYPIPPTLSVGSVIQEDRKKTELYPRDLANKIAHSLKFDGVSIRLSQVSSYIRTT